MTKPKAKNRKRTTEIADVAPCSADELAKRIAAEILTVGASGSLIRCNRAVMMKGKYPGGERDMGGRNAASIAFVVKAHLLAAGSHRRLVSQLPPSTGRIEQAKRHALHNFDEWNTVTGFPTPHTSYYYEIASLIEDAVEFGFGVAHGQTFKEIKRRIKRANND